MAGTATNYDPNTFIVDTIAQLWAGIPIPSAGARMTLATDGTPDATANPSAVHLGHTKEGVKVTINSTMTKHFVDESPAPVKTSIDAVDMMFEGVFHQLLDEDVLKKVTAGFGSYATNTGYKEFAIGYKPITYDGIALIFPTPNDVTKFGVVHIYQGVNEGGLGFGVSRKSFAETPFKFTGYAITSRAAADAIGKYWWQI